MALWRREVISQHLTGALTTRRTSRPVGAACWRILHRLFRRWHTPHVVCRAARWIRSARGLAMTMAWQWGRRYQALASSRRRCRAFDIGPGEVDGGSHTLRNTGGEGAPACREFRRHTDRDGFSAPESFLAVQNIGTRRAQQSALQRPVRAWLRGEYTVQLRRAHVEAVCESTTIIQPG